jgi:hypothetical protein
MSSKKTRRDTATKNHKQASDIAQQYVEKIEAVAEPVEEPVAAMPGHSLQVIDAVPAHDSLGVLDLHKKAMEFANKNIEQAFDFSAKFFAVRQFDEMFDLQQHFLKSQAESFKAQSDELNRIAFDVSVEATKPLAESFETSVESFSKSFAA